MTLFKSFFKKISLQTKGLKNIFSDNAQFRYVCFIGLQEILQLIAETDANKYPTPEGPVLVTP